MANHKQALKRHKQSLRRRARNVRFKKVIKKAIREVYSTLEENNLSGAQEALKKATKVLSRGASKGVIPQTRASRKISRLSIQVAKAAV